MVLSVCILIVAGVPRLVDSSVFTGMWMDGCSNLACAVGFVSSGWVCESTFLQSLCALGFIISITWLGSDLFGIHVHQSWEILWSAFSLLITCSNYVYSQYEMLYGMTLIYWKPPGQLPPDRDELMNLSVYVGVIISLIYLRSSNCVSPSHMPFSHSPQHKNMRHIASASLIGRCGALREHERKGSRESCIGRD